MPNHATYPSGFDLDDEDEDRSEQFESPYSPWPRQAHGQMVCPKCRSPKIEGLHTARRIGGAVGTTAGAAGAFAAAMVGAESGATIGAIIAGPPGLAFGALMGAILAAIAGGTVGGAAGIALGNQVDAKILRNHLCHDCHHAFSLNG